MAVKRTFLNSQQIENIYWLKAEGKSYLEVAEITGISVHKVYLCLRSLRGYLNPVSLHSKKQFKKAYMRAIRNINDEIAKRQKAAHEAVDKFAQGVDGSQEQETPVQWGNRVEVVNSKSYGKVSLDNSNKDRFSLLEQAFVNLQDKITLFIEEQVKEQSVKIVNENFALKEELEALKPKYEVLETEAKKSNWIGSLRQKFGKDNVRGL